MDDKRFLMNPTLTIDAPELVKCARCNDTSLVIGFDREGGRVEEPCILCGTVRGVVHDPSPDDMVITVDVSAFGKMIGWTPPHPGHSSAKRVKARRS